MQIAHCYVHLWYELVVVTRRICVALRAESTRFTVEFHTNASTSIVAWCCDCLTSAVVTQGMWSLRTNRLNRSFIQLLEGAVVLVSTGAERRAVWQTREWWLEHEFA